MFCFNSVHVHHLKAKFCICHDSMFVLWCAKFFNNHFVGIWTKNKRTYPLNLNCDGKIIWVIDWRHQYAQCTHTPDLFIYRPWAHYNKDFSPSIKFFWKLCISFIQVPEKIVALRWPCIQVQWHSYSPNLNMEWKICCKTGPRNKYVVLPYLPQWIQSSRWCSCGHSQ